MTSCPAKPWEISLARILRLSLALVFSAAGIPKILDPQNFVRAIDGFQLLSPILTPLAALVLPWLEILLAATLVCCVWLTATLILTNALFLLFLGAMLSALWRGLDISCGCFGSSSPVPTHMWTTLIRDILCLLASLTLTWLHVRTTKKTR